MLRVVLASMGACTQAASGSYRLPTNPFMTRLARCLLREQKQTTCLKMVNRTWAAVVRRGAELPNLVQMVPCFEVRRGIGPLRRHQFDIHDMTSLQGRTNDSQS